MDELKLKEKFYFKMKIFLLSLLLFVLVNRDVGAVLDPRLSPNNKVGIGILSPEAEIDDASAMVNKNGDWGWVLLVIKKSERNVDRWQSVFHRLADYHLIPIVRIATEVDQKGIWQRPSSEDADSWADFLSKLYWPTKNRYVQIYNEVNRGEEWGGKVDPADYANELEKTIVSLRAKSSDFYILNSPLDLALATRGNDALDARVFFETMESSNPGIFKKLNGWASHSYPNPDFSSSPLKTGRVSIEGWRWEMNQIDKHLEGRYLPVFITETGWKRSDSGNGLSDGEISDYYKIAFENVWDDQRIAAVIPFVFNYPSSEFYPFSFVKKSGDGKEYFKYYYTLADLEKNVGEPIRENLASELRLSIGKVVIKDRNEELILTVRNSGNYVWESKNLKVEILPVNLQLVELVWEKEKIFPGEVAEASIKVKSDTTGNLSLNLRIYDGGEILASRMWDIESETYLSLIMKVVRDVLRV